MLPIKTQDTGPPYVSPLTFQTNTLELCSCSALSMMQRGARNHVWTRRQAQPGPRLAKAVPIWAQKQKPPTTQVSILCGVQALNGQVFLIKGCQFWLVLHKHREGVRKDDFAH